MKCIKKLKERIKQHKFARKEKKRVKNVFNGIIEFDKERLHLYSGSLHAMKRESLAYAIGMEYHRVEKGLTMPDRRLGFGQQVVFNLVVLIRRYIKNGGKARDFEASHALSILREYFDLHKSEGYELLPHVKNALNGILAEYPSPPSKQIDMTPDLLWGEIHSDFEKFSASRHSVRHVQGRVPTENIIKAVQLACNAPSACNRQYVKVKLIDNPRHAQLLLDLQNGNKGFGHLVEQLLLVTVDLSGIRWLAERHDVFTNAGIFIMNLCYALHYHKIAHCMLNWSEPKEKDDVLRSRISIPDNETVVLMIMLGDAPAEFKVTSSPRRAVEDVLTIYGK